MIIDSSKSSLKIVRNSILSGGIVSFPTDTLYALSCDATNPKAIEKLFAIKKRSIVKTPPIIIKSVIEINKHAQMDSLAQKLSKYFWPGALTMILPARLNTCISNVCIRNSTLALRVPNHKVALEILNACDIPLIATSVNHEGYESLNDGEVINQIFGNQIDLIVKTVTPSYNLPSTIVALNNNKVEVVREGAISNQAIINALAE